MHERRQELGGYLPARHPVVEDLKAPPLEDFEKVTEDSGKREISTTMAFVRILGTLARHPELGKRVVPIVPDEARTFGMEGLFRRLGIYASEGQLYEPVDHEQVMYYREDREGQILQEGINEAGAMSSWIAAGTAYANHGVELIPFYIFYSMFGFQRIGDLAWAAGDSRTRGFLLGGTSGRTTLAGEGLQHQDGHSHLIASTIPNCVSYDPTYAYELAVIIQDGLRRMLEEKEDVFYYITVLNENYHHPALPEDAREGILRGMYRLESGADDAKTRVQLLGSGAILREVRAAAELLRNDWGIESDVWSVTSFTELRREGLEKERWNLLHPEETPRESFVAKQLGDARGPVVAATDYVKAHADRIRSFVPGRYVVLGTDGFGRSDTREPLRHFFEVNRYYVAVAALRALMDDGAVTPETVSKAIEKYAIDPAKPSPLWS
jgi:pyruvate dehydrogenase E1 component